VAIVSLFVNKVFLILGSLTLALNLALKEEILSYWSGHFQAILFTVIILCAVMSNLGSTASKIVIERDWVVVLSDGNEAQLSRKCLNCNEIEQKSNF